MPARDAEMLANQISTGIQTVRQFEFEQGSVQEVAQVYLTGYKTMKARSEGEVFQAAGELFAKTTYVAMLLTSHEKELKTQARTGTILADGTTLPDSLALTTDELDPFLGSEAYIGEGARLNALPYNLVRFVRQFNIFSLALIPVRYDDRISGLLLMGTQEKTPLEAANLQPYVNLGAQIGAALTNIHEAEKIAHRLQSMEASARLSTELTQARTENGVLEAVQRLFQATNESVILLKAEPRLLRLATSTNITVDGERVILPELVEVPPAEIVKPIGNRVLVEDVSKLTALSYAHFHPELQKFIEGEATDLPVLDTQLIKLVETAHFTSAAFIPVIRNEELAYLFIVGSRSEPPLTSAGGFFEDIKGHVTEAFKRIFNEQDLEHRLNQDEAIINMGQEITDPSMVVMFIAPMLMTGADALCCIAGTCPRKLSQAMKLAEQFFGHLPGIGLRIGVQLGINIFSALSLRKALAP